MAKPKTDGTAPIAFAELARELKRLGREGFIARYGDAFFLLHAADLSGRSPGDTSIPVERGNTAATTFHVFSVEKSERNGRPYISVGREEDNDIVIQDSTISRYHASLTSLGEGRYGLVDLGSSNGTFVSEEPAPREGDLPAELHTRVSVRFGSVTLKFLAADEFIEFVSAFIGPVR